MPAASNHEKRPAGTRRVHVVTSTPARANTRTLTFARTRPHTQTRNRASRARYFPLVKLQLKWALLLPRASD